MKRHIKQRNSQGRPKKTTDSDIPQKEQDAIVKVMTDEMMVSQKNLNKKIEEFEEYYDMIHCVRNYKPNEWESDIYLPEFVSRLLLQVGAFVEQYFSSRDLVEPWAQSSDPQDIFEGEATKLLLNTILNDSDAHYYQKLVRLLMFTFTHGYGIVKGGYVQTVEETIEDFDIHTDMEYDGNGNPMATDGAAFEDPYTQTPSEVEREEPIITRVIKEDRPTFDIFPTTAVKMSPEYAYCLNDKEYVSFEVKKNLDELKAEAKDQGYFNLHLLDKSTLDTEQYDEKTQNPRGDKHENPDKIVKDFVLEERWGKFPLVVNMRDEKGRPIDWSVGIDASGVKKKGATSEETIITWVREGRGNGIKKLIGFRASPHSKRPMVRFLCYVDPLDDDGFGDGELAIDLQTATNDFYNLSNYRERLSVTPAWKAKKFKGIPNNVRIDPERAIMIDGELDDLELIKVESNLSGTSVHMGLLTGGMDYAMATNPAQMGQSLDRRETATIGAIMNQGANTRANLKLSNLENIGFIQFYDMILNLVNDFMAPETLMNILGPELLQYYNPNRKDKFKPVSQGLETDSSKQAKLSGWMQLLQVVQGSQNPKAPMLLNFIIKEVAKLMGKEYEQINQFLLDEDPMNNMMYQMALAQGGQPQQGGGQQPQDLPKEGGGPQNEQGLPQSPEEMMVRQAMTETGMNAAQSAGQ